MSFTHEGRVYPDGALFPSKENRYPVYTLAQFHRAFLARLEREKEEAEAVGTHAGEGGEDENEHP